MTSVVGMGRIPLSPLLLRSILLVSIVLSSTMACRQQPAVATALVTRGRVERSRDGATEAVARGTTFEMGDALLTAPASGARLALLGGGVVRVGENARLRFRRGVMVEQQPPDIVVELGAAEVDQIGKDVSFVTSVGRARIAHGSRVRVRADGQTATVEVLVGRAVMLEGDREVALEAGHGARIRVGNAEIQRFTVEIGKAVIETIGGADADMAASRTSADDGGLGASSKSVDEQMLDRTASLAASAQPDGEMPAEAARWAGGARNARGESGRADITLVAGESATVHDGRPPTAVRLLLDPICQGEAIVEIGGRGGRRERVTGSGSVVLRLAAGVRPYAVRCAGDPSRSPSRVSGVLTIRRDSGDVPLPRRPPANVIDADGRKYTVLFQTRLPQLTFAWPGATAGAAKLELHVEPSGGHERVLRSTNPNRPLPAGTVQEGTYTLWYRTPDGEQSPKTTLTVRFDNAAPTAQFFRTAGQSADGAIAIDGVTVEGTKVSVAGEALGVDGHGRFRLVTRPASGDDAVAVRLEHPRSGIHYYVRRNQISR